MNILVLSRNPNLYSTQSIVNACTARNHSVWVLDHQRFDLQVSCGELSIFYHGYKIEPIDAIIPRIGATSTQYGAAVIRHFELLGVYTTVTSESLLNARDKFKCLQLLAHSGIPIPKTALLNMIALHHQYIREHFVPPLVTKLKESTHGLGVMLNQDYQNTIQTIEAFQHTQHQILLQEFIKEANGKDIRAFIVDGNIAGAMRREAPAGDFRSNLHRGGTAHPVSLDKEEEYLALKACECLGLKVAGVDILRSKKGPMVLEVNASPGLEGIQNTTGQNIAEKIVMMIERELAQ